MIYDLSSSQDILPNLHTLKQRRSLLSPEKQDSIDRKCQTLGLKTVIHKPWDDVMVDN